MRWLIQYVVSRHLLRVVHEFGHLCAAWVAARCCALLLDLELDPSAKLPKRAIFGAANLRTALAGTCVHIECFGRGNNRHVVLILRYEDKLTKEIEEAGGVTQLAEKYEKIKKTAANERSIQTGYLRSLFLSRKNPETQLVARILPGEFKINVDNDPPRLTSDVRDSGLEEVGDLRQLLYSNKLYTNKIVYAKWTEGLESGKLRSTKFMEPGPISKTITIAHEAHFRLDLYLALQKRGYRHAAGHPEAKSRKKMWSKLLKLVDEDRNANGDAAHAQRMEDMYPDGVPEAEDDAVESDDDFDADKYLS